MHFAGTLNQTAQTKMCCARTWNDFDKTRAASTSTWLPIIWLNAEHMHETEMERDSCAYYLRCSPHYFVSYVFISLRNASLDEYDFIALYGGKLAHTQPNNAAWKQNRYEHGKKLEKQIVFIPFSRCSSVIVVYSAKFSRATITLSLLFSPFHSFTLFHMHYTVVSTWKCIFICYNK